MLETIEDTEKGVLGIAQDKTRTFTVILEVIEVVAEGGHLLLLQHALDVTCRERERMGQMRNRYTSLLYTHVQ